MAETIRLFLELQDGLAGCWEDSISLDKTMIEHNKCPKCRAHLVYKGYSNPTLYKAFGICEPCRFAKLFWSEPVIFSTKKKRFSSVKTKTKKRK